MAYVINTNKSIIKTLITKLHFVPYCKQRNTLYMCITFYSLIQCKLCLDVTGNWRTEALLAGVGAIWAGESGSSCRPELCSRYEECSLMLKEGIRGSDLPSVEPRHIAGYNFPLVRFLKMGREIRGYWDLQHLIHIWGRVLKNLVKDEVQQVI